MGRFPFALTEKRNARPCGQGVSFRTGEREERSASSLGGGRGLGVALADFLETSGLALQIAQVEQARAAHAAAAHDLELLDARRVGREDALDADAAAGALAHGERLADAAARATDHGALEDLDAIL